MLKLIIWGTAVILILVAIIYSSSGITGPVFAQTETDNTEVFGRHIDNVAFGVGEKLYYDIGYGFINAGNATMEVVELIEYNDRPCYQIISTARSNKFFSSFYRVEDQVESITDAIGIFSWKFEKNIQEGSYRAERSYQFDQSGNKAFYKKDTIDIKPYIQDALSVLYFARTQELKVGHSIHIDNFTDGKYYPLELTVLRKETIKVKAGRFDCLVVEPLIKSLGVFKHEGKLTVWLTDDKLKLPVLMKSKVIVGSISAELTDYELGEIIEF